MRYTTVLDIREWPSVYASTSARLLYLHICLAARYEGKANGLLYTTYRKLADDSGLTLSATRFALKKLEFFGLVRTTIVKARYSRQLVIQPAKKIDKKKNP